MLDLSEPFVEVLRSLRIQYSDKGTRLQFCCPFHDDKIPSAGVYKESGRFYCFSCDLILDLSQFYSKFHGEEDWKYSRCLESTYKFVGEVEVKSRVDRIRKERFRLDSLLKPLRSSTSMLVFGQLSDYTDRLLFLYKLGLISDSSLSTHLTSFASELRLNTGLSEVTLSFLYLSDLLPERELPITSNVPVVDILIDDVE